MAEESSLHRKQNKRTQLLWSLLSGLALGVLFAVWFYFILENDSLSFFLDQWWPVAILAYALLVMLLFFTIGLLWGQETGDPNDSAQVIVLATLIQMPIALALLGMFSWVFDLRYMDHYGVLFALFGVDIESGGIGAAWWLGLTFIILIPMGMVGSSIAGVIGRHFSHQRPNPGETPPS